MSQRFCIFALDSTSYNVFVSLRSKALRGYIFDVDLVVGHRAGTRCPFAYLPAIHHFQQKLDFGKPLKSPL